MGALTCRFDLIEEESTQTVFGSQGMKVMRCTAIGRVCFYHTKIRTSRSYWKFTVSIV